MASSAEQPSGIRSIWEIPPMGSSTMARTTHPLDRARTLCASSCTNTQAKMRASHWVPQPDANKRDQRPYLANRGRKKMDLLDGLWAERGCHGIRR